MNIEKAKTNFYQTLTAFFLILAIVIVYSAFWGPAKKFGNSLWPVRTTNVSAEGKAVVEPDIATFSFSVTTEGADPQKIADENNKTMTKAINFVKAQGIDAKDIKTTQYQLNPKYSYDRFTGKSSIYAYELAQTTFVKVRELKNNLSKIPKILGGLPELGVNSVSSISFSVDDPDKYLSDARVQAFAKARAKAQAIAAANGLKLGKILSVNEYGGPQPTPYYEKALGMGGGVAAPSVAAPSIEPGSQEITLNVTITYELR